MMKSTLSFFVCVWMLMTGYGQTFQDDVSKETIGDFPSQWDLVGGMATVNQQDGYKYINLMHGGIIKPIVNGQTNNYLSADFTLEWDVFFDRTSSLYGQRFELRLWDGAYGYQNGNIRYKPIVIYRDGLETDWNQPEIGNAKNHLKDLQTLEPVWRHLKVEVKGGKLRILMDDQLILFLPRFKMQPTMMSIGGAVNDSQFQANIGFTNMVIRSMVSQSTVAMIVDNKTKDILDINLLSNLKKNTRVQELYPNTKFYLGNITGDYTLRPVDVADVKKPLNVDYNTYGDYTLLPTKEAQLSFDFETAYEINSVIDLSTTNATANMQSWNGDYFTTNEVLALASHELVLTNGTLRLIGETEKNLNTSIDNGECEAQPSAAQLQILADPNSLFNRRLQFVRNFSVEDLRGVPAVQQVNGEFVLPQQVRFSTTPTENYTVIPIVAHILRQSNHSGGLSLDTLYTEMQRANDLLDKYGVYLHLDGIRFIDDDTLFGTIYKNKDTDEDGVNDAVDILNITNRNVNNKLNIYFVPKAEGGKAGSVASWSKFPATENHKQHIIMNNSHSGHVLVHEIGHWFNLLHTHDTGNGAELTDGSNCATAGDLCCDTPADPKLSKKVDSSCNYTGSDTDTSNNPYNPSTSNIMSYTQSRCMNDFTEEQITRMYNAYLGMEDDRGYTFEVNTDIGQKIQTLSLNPGWKAVQHFESAGKVYMIFFNESTSEITINQMTSEGKRGVQVAYKDYNASMSFIGTYKKGTTHYLALINYDQGQLGIVKLNSNGSFGPAQAYQIGTGWGSAFVYNHQYLIFFKTTGGTVTYQINSDGRLGSKISEQPYYNSSSDIIAFGQYVMSYDRNSGYLKRVHIGNNGSFNIVSGVIGFLDKNWSSLSYSTQLNPNGQSMRHLIMIDEDTGQYKQYGITDNGTLIECWYDSAKIRANMEPGFDTLTPFDVFDGNHYRNYLMISNSTTGQVITYHLNNNL